MQYQQITIPSSGEAITIDSHGQWRIPMQPIIAYIDGDGVGQDISPLVRRILDHAVSVVYQSQRKIHWLQLFNGEQAAQLYDGDWFPQETIHAIRQFKCVLKGPLTTPLGGGFRSLNVALRQEMDLYVNIRDISSYPGLPSPLKQPEKTNITVIRDSSEDVYSGIEWSAGSADAERVLDFLCQEMGVTRLRFDKQCGIGIKNISQEGSERVVRYAIQYALKHQRRSVTLVHKGNVLKCTDGAFKRWGFALAQDEFNATTDENGRWLRIKREQQDDLIIKEVIADNMLQQALLTPEQFDVVVCTNQNGDYLADMLSAQVGGVGIMPVANLNTDVAIFEPTHGTFQRIAGQDSANPMSSLLSAVMMLRFIGWQQAADAIEQALIATLKANEMTFDLANANDNAITLSCSEFATSIIGRLKAS